MENKNQQFYDEVLSVINDSNLDTIERNYKIGELIHIYRKIYEGKTLIENLSKYISDNYSSIKGYSFANLSNMQRFYKRYRNYPDLIEFAKQLEWTKIVLLLKLTDIKETEYYLKSAIRNNWSRETLEQEIEEEKYEDFKEKVERTDYKIELKSININNYKSVVKFELTKPPRFLVFAGPNSSGKSNIFESMEFLIQSLKIKGEEIFELFGGKKEIINFNHQNNDITKFQTSITIEDNNVFSFSYRDGRMFKEEAPSEILNEKFYNSFSRLFISNQKNKGSRLVSSDKLHYDAANLNQILKPLLKDKEKKEELLNWLTLFIPGLRDLKIESDPLSGEQDLLIFENNAKNPIRGNLISDGTFNTISLLALLYQKDEQQFLLIEEPENGLNPKLQEQFIELFRKMCENEGHYIWLVTHSQTIVSKIKPSELIIVDKINNETKIKTFKDEDFEGVSMDEAWLNNLLEGGLPW